MADPRDRQIEMLSQSLGAAFQMIATLAVTMKRAGIGDQLALQLSTVTPVILDERAREMWEHALRQIGAAQSPNRPD